MTVLMSCYSDSQIFCYSAPVAQQEISTFSKRLTILIGLGVVGAMAFGLSISLYRNILFEETLDAFSVRNRNLREQIDLELEELTYYRSVQYRDKYAKENLGRVNPGEKVLILTDRPDIVWTDTDLPNRREGRDAAYHQYLQKIPVMEHWKLYLFDTQWLEKLKRYF